MDRCQRLSAAIDRILCYSAATANILHLTSSCNIACAFCSHRYNPPEVRTFAIPPLSEAEVLRLAGLLRPGRRIVIGESVTRIYEGEPFTHPQFLRILRLLRERFGQTEIQITTNGTLLTEAVAAELAELGGITVCLSLNSITRAGRLLLMGDTGSFAPEAPALLAAYGIPYHGSIVGMPHLVGWDDIRATVRALSCHGARTVRLFVPGFTRLAPQAAPLAPGWTESFRREAAALAEEVQVPLTVEPNVPADLAARVEGVIAGSPAARCGIRRGDVILTVAGRKVRSRVEAFDLLLKDCDMTVTVRRGDQELAMRLIRRLEERPGVVMLYDLKPETLAAVRRHVRRHRRQGKTAVLTSTLANPLWRAALADEPDAEVIAVGNRFFGGTIEAGGLLTVGDFAAALENLPFRQVILPKIAFDQDGLDLTGQSWRTLAIGGRRVVLV